MWLPVAWHCGRPDPGVATAPHGMDQLRVVDINVWAGLDYEGNLWMGEYESAREREDRYRSLVAQIRALRPDVIGVHEANKLPHYATRLAQDLGYDQIHHVGVGGVRAGPVGLPWNLREGDAILARKELRLTWAGRRQLSGGPVGKFFTFHFSDATQVLAGRIFWKGRTVFLFTTHWHSSLLDTPQYRQEFERRRSQSAWPAEQVVEVEREMKEGSAWRRREAARTLAFIREVSAGQPFVLFGDFNATEDTQEIALLREGGLIDTFRAARPQAAGFTWQPLENTNHLKYYNKPLPAGATLRATLEAWHESLPKRIDYIFAGGGSPGAWRPAAARVVLDQPSEGRHTSDHYGILADLELAPEGRR